MAHYPTASGDEHDAFIAAPVALSQLASPSSDASVRSHPNARLGAVVRDFFATFRSSKPDALRVAIAPGRVNLIGEHIDYEGYSVLPMAIAQSMAVAIASPSNTTNNNGLTLRIANTNAAFATATVSLPLSAMATTGDARFDALSASLDASTHWVQYVLCGYMAVIEHAPAAAASSIDVDILVDGAVPPACGLSSSSALVVASALAFASLLCAQIPTRTQLAERCRYAEHYVGTAGGGMDQAVSCLATPNAALFVTFYPTLQLEATTFPDAFRRGDAVFMVVNSGVQAHKAQDAAVRFNKRVVECALATKLLGKRLGIHGWEEMTKLRELEMALVRDHMPSKPLLEYVETIRDHDAFTLEALQNELSPSASLLSLFTGSRLERAMKQVLQTESTFRLWQRARHVWSEAERVRQFKELLTTSVNNDPLPRLGALMLASHASCRDDYECSCPELDVIVDTATHAGAYGARLTGAGWGGCAVVLVASDRVASVRKALELDVFNGHIPPGSIFESAAADGAQLFTCA